MVGSSPTLGSCPILTRPEELGWGWLHLASLLQNVLCPTMSTSVEASPANWNRTSAFVPEAGELQGFSQVPVGGVCVILGVFCPQDQVVERSLDHDEVFRYLICSLPPPGTAPTPPPLSGT